MARGRQESEWMQTQIIVQRVCAAFGVQVPGEYANPFYQKPKRSKANNQRAMEALLDGLDKAYGGR